MPGSSRARATSAARRAGRPRRSWRRPQPRRGRPERRDEMRRDGAVVRLHATGLRRRRVVHGDARASQRQLLGEDVVGGQHRAQLRERGGAPRRLVIRVLDRPERVVGHAQHDGRLVLRGELDEQLDDGRQVAHVLEDLEARDRTRGRTVEDGGAHSGARAGVVEVGGERRDGGCLQVRRLPRRRWARRRRRARAGRGTDRRSPTSRRARSRSRGRTRSPRRRRSARRRSSGACARRVPTDRCRR